MPRLARLALALAPLTSACVRRPHDEVPAPVHAGPEGHVVEDMPKETDTIAGADLAPPPAPTAEQAAAPLAPLVPGPGAGVVLDTRGWEVTAVPDRVIVLDTDFLHLRAHDPVTGAELWRTRAQERANGRHTLHVVGERVLLHAGPDLIAVDTKTGAVVGRHPAGGFNGSEDHCHVSLIHGLDLAWHTPVRASPTETVCATDCECSVALFRCDTGEPYGERMHGSVTHLYHSLDEPHDNVCWTPPRLLGRVKGRTLLALERDPGDRGYFAAAVDDAGKPLWRRPELGEAVARFRTVEGDVASDTCWSIDETDLTVWTCSTGQLKWRDRWPDEDGHVRTDARKLAGDRLLVWRRSDRAAKVEVKTLSGGKRVWLRELPPNRLALTPGEDPADLAWDTGLVHAWLDAATGRPLRELALANDHALVRDPRGGGYLRIGGADHDELDREGRLLRTVPKDIHKAIHVGERFLATLDDQKQLVVVTRPGLTPALTSSGSFSPDEATGALAPAGLLLYEHRGREPLRIVVLRATD